MLVGIDVAANAALLNSAALRTAARAAEQLGYASVWVFRGRADALTCAEADALRVVAAATERIPLGAALDAGHRHDPASLAAALAAAQHLAEGRLVVALDASAAAIHALARRWPTSPPCPPPPALLGTNTPSIADVGSGTAGWSPLDPPVGVLCHDAPRLLAAAGGGELRIVPRLRLRLTGEPLPFGRADWSGSVSQVASDLAAVAGAGVSEVVLAFDDEPRLDEALERWALLAEALEAGLPR